VHDVEDAIVAGHFQLRWMDNPDHRARVVGYAKQWYLPHNDPAAIDAALARLEATDVWVREADGSRKAMAALKDMTSQLIGRFCQSALEATRTVYGPENLTRYNAELIVPDETVMEIAVMKGLATTFVMTTEHRQPIYERQREVLHALVTALSATGARHLEPMFAADWLDAADDAARLRVVIDQVASLTDGSALAMYERLVGSLPSLW
jgi:dGTPase